MLIDFHSPVFQISIITKAQIGRPVFTLSTAMEANVISAEVSSPKTGSGCSDQTLQNSHGTKLLTEEQPDLLANTNEGVNELIKGTNTREGSLMEDCTTEQAISKGDNSNISETNVPLFDSKNLIRDSPLLVKDDSKPETFSTDVDVNKEEGEEKSKACSTAEDVRSFPNDSLPMESEDQPTKHVIEKSVLLEGQDTGQEVTFFFSKSIVT